MFIIALIWSWGRSSWPKLSRPFAWLLFFFRQRVYIFLSRKKNFLAGFQTIFFCHHNFSGRSALTSNAVVDVQKKTETSKRERVRIAHKNVCCSTIFEALNTAWLAPLMQKKKSSSQVSDQWEWGLHSIRSCSVTRDNLKYSIPHFVCILISNQFTQPKKKELQSCFHSGRTSAQPLTLLVRCVSANLQRKRVRISLDASFAYLKKNLQAFSTFSLINFQLSLQLSNGLEWRTKEKCDTRNDQHSQGMAPGA